MRLPTWQRLAILCLIFGRAAASDSWAMARMVPPAASQVLIEKKIHGYGPTPKDAEANALERACDWLAVHANLDRAPSPDFLREKGMVHFVGEPTEKDLELSGHVNVVTLQLEVTAEQARDLQKQDQQQRMKERQKLALLVLIGVVSLLGVAGVYLRLTNRKR